MSASGPSQDEDGGGLITEINVTPMVDIMLVLLIIFMVTASLIGSPSLKVELPKGSTAKTQPNKTPDVLVVVTRTGELELDHKRLPVDQLANALQREHDARPGARLLILADRKSYHGNVVRVMDIAKLVGFQRLGVAIDPGH